MPPRVEHTSTNSKNPLAVNSKRIEVSFDNLSELAYAERLLNTGLDFACKQNTRAPECVRKNLQTPSFSR